MFIIVVVEVKKSEMENSFALAIEVNNIHISRCSRPGTEHPDLEVVAIDTQRSTDYEL